MHETKKWSILINSELLFIFHVSADALKKNQDIEFERNKERFLFLKVRSTELFDVSHNNFYEKNYT